MLHKISKKNAGIGIIVTNIFTIATFLLVILKILPFNSISGGRLESYQAAYQTAITSIAIICFQIPLIAMASGLIKFERHKFLFKVWLLLSFVLIAILLYQSEIMGIVIISLGIPLIAIASGLIKFQWFTLFFKVWLWFFFIMNCLNIIGNLLGVTAFEKTIMTLVTVIQAVLFFRLATNKGSMGNTNLGI